MTNAQEELNKLKHVIGSKLVFAILLICVIAFPISLLSWQSSGFESLHAVHVLLIVVALLLAVNRKADKYMTNVCFTVSFLSLLIAYGLYQFGWSAGTLSVLISAACIITITYSIKAALIYVVFSTIAIAFFFLMSDRTFALTSGTVGVTSGPYNSAIYSLSCVVIGLGLISILLIQFRRKLTMALTALEEQEQEIDYLANHDHLTGLSSPRLAQEQLELTLNMAKRHEFKAAILYIDIDKFRLINEALGHDAGDFALKEVAKMLKELIRDTDIACRQGGDEFLLILHYPVSREACDIICKRLISAFDARFPYKDHEIKINLNIGVAIYPDNGSTQFELRTKADKAKQKSKSDQKHHFTFAE